MRIEFSIEINFEWSISNIDFQWEMQFPPFVISKHTGSPSRNKDSRGHIKVRKRRRFIFPWPNICFFMEKVTTSYDSCAYRKNRCESPKNLKNVIHELKYFTFFVLVVTQFYKPFFLLNLFFRYKLGYNWRPMIYVTFYIPNYVRDLICVCTLVLINSKYYPLLQLKFRIKRVYSSESTSRIVISLFFQPLVHISFFSKYRFYRYLTT